MPEPQYDALIVGGGPAGCSAALHLAAAGASVLLCEAGSYPRDKLCGEFLSPECLPLLAALGVADELRALGPEIITTAALTGPRGATWETRLPAPAWGLTRRALDAALAARAQRAGVELWPNTTVTGVSGDLAAGFRVALRGPAAAEVGARFVIAAHGKRAALDRSLGRRFIDKPQPFVALKRHFTGPPVPGRIELHTFPGGYCGLSAIEQAAGPGAANLCFLAHTSAWQPRAAGPEAADRFLAWLRTQSPALDAWLSQAQPLGDRWLSIAQVAFGPKPPVEADVLMAGDAAGLITPLAGDGIAMALRGGQLAAAHVLAGLRGQSPAQLRAAYARAWQREFGARLRVGRFAQAFLLRPRFMAVAVRLLRALPALGAYFVTHTRDLRPLPLSKEKA